MSIDWKRRALRIAEVEFNEGMEQHWGVEALVAENAVYYFNNSPPKGEMIARDKQSQEIRIRLMAHDISELGYGEYPEQGVGEGYTFVMIFEAGEDQVPWIRGVIEEVMTTVY